MSPSYPCRYQEEHWALSSSERPPPTSNSSPIPKRTRLSHDTRDDSPSQNRRNKNSRECDVIFGPVGRDKPMTDNDARDVAYASVQLICPHLTPNAVCNALPAHGFHDHISIRFRYLSNAEDFVQAVNDDPPEPGQTAVPAVEAQRNKPQGRDRQHLLAIMRGDRAQSSPVPSVPRSQPKASKW
ncbi:hypothetical protein C0992_008052 [Termitomyces sp. T32_za158]|nr:hypothetical protein C0992_008052 [Termitomyces sp. T32_za158]